MIWLRHSPADASPNPAQRCGFQRRSCLRIERVQPGIAACPSHISTDTRHGHKVGIGHDFGDFVRNQHDRLAICRHAPQRGICLILESGSDRHED